MPRAVFKASSRDLILHYLAQVFSGETNIGRNLSIFVRAVKLWLLLKLRIKIYQTICNKLTRKVSIRHQFWAIFTPLRSSVTETPLKEVNFFACETIAAIIFTKTALYLSTICFVARSQPFNPVKAVISGLSPQNWDVIFQKKMNYTTVGNAEYR